MRPLRILLVEDDPLILLDTGLMLRGLGHEITPAGSAEEARAALAAGEFDLLMTDIGLGRHSGLDLAREARAARPGLKVIFLSGYGAPLGAIAVLKPFQRRHLEAALRQAQGGG